MSGFSKLFKKNKNILNHSLYGKVYLPYYNLNAPIFSDEPEIYNKFGKKMKTFFIRDAELAHNPYYQSNYFAWDRYNFGLKTHFYSHNFMLETMGNPDKKYGILIESEAVSPKSYKIFENNKGLEKDFDYIFTYSHKILDKIDNARFVPFCAQLWNKNITDSCAYKKKTKNISILSSDKLMCEMHKYRYELAKKCKRENLADTFGTFDGGSYVDISETLIDYRYTICIENDINPYFFTERITSALAAQTVPIYCGASEIDKFFNPDGIIKLKPCGGGQDDIEKILKSCTREDYEDRLPAILDNYERAKKYINIWDLMYEEYLADNI